MRCASSGLIGSGSPVSLAYFRLAVPSISLTSLRGSVVALLRGAPLCRLVIAPLCCAPFRRLIIAPFCFAAFLGLAVTAGLSAPFRRVSVAIIRGAPSLALLRRVRRFLGQRRIQGKSRPVRRPAGREVIRVSSVRGALQSCPSQGHSQRILCWSQPRTRVVRRAY